MAEDLPTIKAKLKDTEKNVYVIPYVPTATTSEAGIISYDGTTIKANGAGQLYVDGVSGLQQDVAQLKEDVLTKQDALLAGDNITITEGTNVISATDTTYTAGSNIAISQNNEISATYKAGNGISISDAGVISTVPYVPPNVYTTDNLAADKNVSITTKSAGTGGIDEHTIACWHFDGDAIDIVHGNEIQGINTFSSLPGEYKFGGQAAKVNAEYLSYGEEYTKYQLSTPITLGDTFTIDFWIHAYNSNYSYPYYDGFCNFSYALDNNTYSLLQVGQSISSISIPHYSDYISGTSVLDTKMHHVAVVNNQGNIRCYYDGKDMTFGLTNGHQVSGLIIENLFFSSSNTNTYVWLDELRISDVARWTENFEVPTSQYTSSEYAEPTYEIDTAHEFLSQDNLISNQNIRVITKPAEGGIDEHTLALYDFEEQDFTNTGTGTLYYNPSVKQYDSFTSQYSKFGTYSLFSGSSGYGYGYATITPYATPQDKPFTYDCWCLSIGNRYAIASLRCYPNTGSSERYISLSSYYGQLTFSGPSGDNYVIGAVSANTWHHYGICYDNGMRTITIFVDGRLIYTYQVPPTVTHFNSIRVLHAGEGASTYWDEARFSDIVRYTDDFTPPTQAYTTATGPTNYSFDTTVNLDTLATKEDALRKSTLVGGKGITLVDGKKNYSVAGTLLFNFDEVWGFSDSNYIYHDNVIKNALHSFKIFTAFKLNSAVTDQSIFDSKTKIGLRLTTTANNNLRLRVSSDGSSTYVVDINGSKVLTPNQKMYACIEYNNTTGYRLLVKGPSDADWVEEATSSVTTVPFIDSEMHVLGESASSSGYALDGYIYLADTWVEVDDELAWAPYSDTIVIDADEVEDAYTVSNLTGGKNIMIGQIPTQSITPDMIGLFHFEDHAYHPTNQFNATQDAPYFDMSNTACEYSATDPVSPELGFYGKIYHGNIYGYSMGRYGWEGPHTSAGWFKIPSTWQSTTGYTSKIQLGYISLEYQNGTDTSIRIVTNSTTRSSIAYTPDTWIHCAYDYDESNYQHRLYINGSCVYSEEYNSGGSMPSFSYIYADEIVLYNTAKYKGINFTPATIPYYAGNEPAAYKVDCTLDVVTSIDAQSSDVQVPSAKCMYDIVGDIETALQTIRGVQQ